MRQSPQHPAGKDQPPRHHSPRVGFSVCHGRPDRDLLNDPYAPGALTTLFQPIFRLVDGGRELFGAEALTRGPAGSSLEDSATLFRFAREAGTVCALDRACIDLALRRAATLPGGPVLFLNLHPETLKHDRGFPAFLEGSAHRWGVPLNRIVVELLEYARIAWVNPSKRCRQLGGLRQHGVRLALDDVHTGVDDVGKVAQYQPDFIKLDGEVLRGARLDVKHRGFITQILDLAERIGTAVIAEGLETRWDLDLAHAAEIPLAQGYHLGAPVPPAGFLFLADGTVQEAG
ncbi:MAG: EAL domain-containing protein [Gemmatimonadales bacterium]